MLNIQLEGNGLDGGDNYNPSPSSPWSYKSDLVQDNETWTLKYPETGKPLDALKRGSKIYCIGSTSFIKVWSNYRINSVGSGVATLAGYYVDKLVLSYLPRRLYLLRKLFKF